MKAYILWPACVIISMTLTMGTLWILETYTPNVYSLAAVAGGIMAIFGMAAGIYFETTMRK